MNEYLRKCEKLAQHISNIDEKIGELQGHHPDEVDWVAIGNLEDKRRELKQQLDALHNEHNGVKPDMVNHPKHYERENAIECIDEMEMIFGPEELMIYCKLATWKYRYRSADKNGAEDIAKSDWYMKKYKELREKIQCCDTCDSQPHTITSTTSFYGDDCQCHC